MSTSQVQPITSSVFTGYPDGATPFDSETSQKLVDSINLLLKETTGASSSIDFTKRIVVLLDPKGNSVLACMDQNLADMDLSQQVNYEVNLLKIGVQIDDERGKIGFHNFEILDSLKGLAHSEENRPAQHSLYCIAIRAAKYNRMREILKEGASENPKGLVKKLLEVANNESVNVSAVLQGCHEQINPPPNLGSIQDQGKADAGLKGEKSKNILGAIQQIIFSIGAMISQALKKLYVGFKNARKLSPF